MTRAGTTPSRRVRWRHPARPGARLAPVTAVLTLVAVASWVALASSARVDPLYDEVPHVVFVVVLGLGFITAESAQIHFVLGRQTYSVSLSELPLVVGLFLVAPAYLLMARLGAYALVALSRRMSWDKAAMNFALFTAEVGLASLIFHGVGTTGIQDVGTTGIQDPSTWQGAYLGVLGATVAGACAVGAGIRRVQATLTWRQFTHGLLLPTALTAVFSVTVGLLVVLLVSVEVWAVVGLGLLGAVLVIGFRRFGQLEAEHKDLEGLYELTRTVTTTLGDPELEEALVERVRGLLRCEQARLYHRGGREVVAVAASDVADETAATVVQHGEAPVPAADPVRRRVLAGESVLIPERAREPVLERALEVRRAGELIAVPVRRGGDVVASLEVQDRQGRRSHFWEADRTLLETIAVHIGVAMENVDLLQRLRWDADHDPLTGLPNLRAFTARLDRALKEAPADHLVAVLSLDLQSFKDVNDTLGRGSGDAVLGEVAARVLTAADDPTSVARLGSDEFGVFVVVPDIAAARAAAAALQDALTSPMQVGAIPVEVGCVVGIAVHPEHATEAVALCQRADVAMYAAKRTSRGVLVYSPTMDAPSVARFGLVSELRRALEASELVVFYQPQVALPRNELVGVEALVRWNHPEHGVISPDDFIPVAEHTGLIAPLTSYVLRTALRDLRHWHAAGHRFGVSVNLSVRSLVDPGFADEVRAALEESEMAPQALTLEITETGVMNDPARSVPVLERLRGMGVRLSIDDFGIGQSSLTYLRRLPVSEVKIDRSFVSGMVHDAGDLAIVRAVVDLSAPFGLDVVAEGVENEETRAHLQELGCAVIQGYLLSRPLGRDELDRWIDRRTVPVAATAADRGRWLRVVS